MERFAENQEKVWNEWAERFEKSWEQWSEELESEEVDSEIVGELIERNLEMLSEMPLGQLVDGLLEEGLGELSDAPWESLEELGELAAKCFGRTAGRACRNVGRGKPRKGKLSSVKSANYARLLKRFGDEWEAQCCRSRGGIGATSGQRNSSSKNGIESGRRRELLETCSKETT